MQINRFSEVKLSKWTGTRTAAQDLENVEAIIMQKKEKLKNSKDIQETDRLLAELEALEWLQAQIAVFTLGNNEAVWI